MGELGNIILNCFSFYLFKFINCIIYFDFVKGLVKIGEGKKDKSDSEEEEKSPPPKRKRVFQLDSDDSEDDYKQGRFLICLQPYFNYFFVSK